MNKYIQNAQELDLTRIWDRAEILWSVVKSQQKVRNCVIVFSITIKTIKFNCIYRFLYLLLSETSNFKIQEVLGQIIHGPILPTLSDCLRNAPRKYRRPPSVYFSRSRLPRISSVQDGGSGHEWKCQQLVLLVSGLDCSQMLWYFKLHWDHFFAERKVEWQSSWGS